jgi:DNA-binding NtrC family response regulator
VLITGPTGAGKEIVARFIHASGDRRGGSFVALNCEAVAPALFESEFFGHVRGAFTGAVEDRPGVFGEADGGTLLLDEVVEVPAALQPKLLRAVETGEYRPVGSSRTLKSSARVVAATNADPRSGRLREDLYYRLAVFHIDVRPLAERPEDVVPLAERFVAECGRLYGRDALSLDAGAIDALRAHPWPGNVRELRNAVERAVASTRGAVIDAAALDLQPVVGTAGDLESVERAHILKVLEECEGNKAEAARRLGIGKSTLQRKLKRYESE